MKSWKVFFAIIVIFFVAVPLVLIVVISSIERTTYTIDEDYEIISKSYGEPALITRGEVRETINLKGIIESNEIVQVKLGDFSSNKIIILKEVGEEIKKNEVVAIINSLEITSTVNGVVESVDYEMGIIKIKSFDKLLFKTIVPLDFNHTILTNINSKETLTLLNLSNIAIENQREATFELSNNNYLYGENISFDLYTNKIEDGVIKVTKTCVFSKEDDMKKYIRIVNSSGDFVEEVEVKTGIENSTHITVTGVEEDRYCDTGYKKYIDSSK